jgi:hypothetical protein
MKLTTEVNIVRRLIWLPLAGALLIGGAAVAAAAPTTVQEVAGTVLSVPGRATGLLADVLADLVGQSVITQDQADAITDELDSRVAERRAEFQARREEMQALHAQIRTFLEDEVITADEVAQLPDGELKTALESLLDDDGVTLDELRELGGFFRFGPGHGPGRGPGHHRGGPGFWQGPDEPTDEPTDSENEGTTQDS